MTTARARTPLADVLRREAYLARLSFFMDDLPRARRRAVYRDLRADLTAAAHDEGMAAAVRDLGPAAVLAHGYRDAEGRPLPRWLLGSLVGGTAALLWLTTTLTYALGLLDAARSAQARAGETVATTGSYLWSDITARSTADSVMIETTGPGFLVMLVVYAAVAFVVARGWRSWTRRSPATDHA